MIRTALTHAALFLVLVLPIGSVAEAQEEKPKTELKRVGLKNPFGFLRKKSNDEEKSAPNRAKPAVNRASPADSKDKERGLIGWMKKDKSADKATPEKVTPAPAPKPTKVDDTKTEGSGLGGWLANRREASAAKKIEKEKARAIADAEAKKQKAIATAAKEKAAADKASAPKDKKLALPKLSLPFKRSSNTEKSENGSVFTVAHKTPLYQGDPGLPPFSMSYKHGVQASEIVFVTGPTNKPFTKIKRLHNGESGYVNSVALKRATQSQYLAYRAKVDDGYRPSSHFQGGESLVASRSGSSTSSSARRRTPGASSALFNPIAPPESYDEPALPSSDEAGVGAGTENRRPLSSILFGGQ